MIDKLEMFIALATEKHFRRAAEVCGVTQPTLSAAIKSLEDQLGVQLVWRGARFQGLTPEGNRVLDWARRIVGDTRAMRQEMRAAREGLSGNLRLAAIPTALPAMTRLTTPFRKRHPNVHLTITSTASSDILAELENLEIDAGVTYLDNEPLGRVTSVPLYSERYAYVCAAHAAEAARTGMTWAEAAALPLGLLTPDMQNRRIVNEVFGSIGCDVAPEIEANSVVVLLAHVLEAGVATILPTRTAEMFTATGLLTAIPLSDPETSQRVGLVAPFREPHTPVIEALLKVARSAAGD